LLPVDRTWANDSVLESATFTILLFCDGAEAGCETASHVAQQPCEHFFAEMDGSLFEPTTEMSSQEAFLVILFACISSFLGLSEETSR